jgi:colicin import membrane protein
VKIQPDILPNHRLAATHVLAQACKTVYFTASEEDMMRTFSMLAILLVISQPVLAQAPEALPAPQTREQAAAQRAQAEAARTEAQRVYTRETAACYKKFLVNDCLDDAKKKQTEAVIGARNLEKPAREFLRAEDKRDLAEKEAKRTADQLSQQASQKEQAEKFHQDEAAKAIARDEKQATKLRQAEEGRKKTAADQAKRKAKTEQRAKKDAERAVKKEAKAKKQAERDAKKAAKPEPPPAN